MFLAPVPALISDANLRRKPNGCNNYISVIRLFIRHTCGSELLLKRIAHPLRAYEVNSSEARSPHSGAVTQRIVSRD